jgi:hypothetical protein
VKLLKETLFSLWASPFIVNIQPLIKSFNTNSTKEAKRKQTFHGQTEWNQISQIFQNLFEKEPNGDDEQSKTTLDELVPRHKTQTEELSSATKIYEEMLLMMLSASPHLVEFFIGEITQTNCCKSCNHKTITRSRFTFIELPTTPTTSTNAITIQNEEENTTPLCNNLLNIELKVIYREMKRLPVKFNLSIPKDVKVFCFSPSLSFFSSFSLSLSHTHIYKCILLSFHIFFLRTFDSHLSISHFVR